MEAEPQSVVNTVVNRRQLGCVLEVIQCIDVVGLLKIEKATVDEHFQSQLFSQ